MTVAIANAMANHGRPLRNKCQAGFFNCRWDTANSTHCQNTCTAGHTCLPEPVISYAENFKKHILSMPEDSWDRIESMSCYQEWGEFMSGE